MTVRVCIITACICAAMIHTARPQGWEWQNPIPYGWSINDVILADQDWAYAPCADGNFLRSGDGGKNWEHRKIASRGLARVQSPSRGVVVVIADNASVLRSTDFGVTWSEQFRAQTMQPAYDLKSIPGGGLLALFGQNILTRSDDEGITWSTVPTPFGVGVTIRTVAAQSSTTWYCASARQVFKTSDRGSTWEVDSSFRPEGFNTLVFVDSLYGYQLRNGQLLQTRDGGATWTECNIFGFDNNLAVAAGPRMGSTVFCLSTGKYLVNKSVDDGSTWNISLTSTVFNDGYPSAMSFSDPLHGLVVGEGGRIVRTDDGGVSWSIVRGLGYIGALSDMVFTSPRNGITLSYTPTILLTTNGGVRWDESVPHPDYAPRRISMFTPSTGYVYAFDAASWPHILRTSNAGRAWEYRSVLPIAPNDARFIQPQEILAVSSDTVFVSASNGLLYRSTDGAMHWDSLFTCTQFANDWESGIGLFWFPPRTLIYTGSQGVGTSTDGGDTWSCRPTTGLRNVQFFHPDTAVAVALGRSSISFDGGGKWNIIAPVGFALMHFFNADEGVGLAYRTVNGDPTGIVYRTSDRGANWTQTSLHESGQDWYGWHFISRDEGWAYGYAGMIRHTTSGGLTRVPEQEAATGSLAVSPFYPNPLSTGHHRAASVIIRNGDHIPARVSITLYSLLGEKIAAVYDGLLAEGEHVVTIDAATLSRPLRPGAYVCRIETAKAALNRMFLVTE